MLRLNSLERCHLIMRWLHQRGKGQKRTAKFIAEQLDLPHSSVTATFRDWSECFTRVNGLGYTLSGAFPEGVEINLNYPLVKTKSAPELVSDGRWNWNPDALQVVDEFFKNSLGAGVKSTFRNCSENEARMYLNAGKTQVEIFKRLLGSGVIGTTNQDEWSPFT